MVSKDPQNTGRSGPTKSQKVRGISQKEQSERFKETARELEVDESGQAFEVAVKQIIPPRTGSRSPE